MSIVTIPSPIHREPELLGKTVVVIGGSSGIGFERHVVHAPDNHLDARAVRRRAHRLRALPLEPFLATAPTSTSRG